MEQGNVVDLDRATALEAARLSIQHAIAMADGVIAGDGTSAPRDAVDSGFGFRRIARRAPLREAMVREPGRTKSALITRQVAANVP
jgi:hypothetical protein